MKKLLIVLFSLFLCEVIFSQDMALNREKAIGFVEKVYTQFETNSNISSVLRNIMKDEGEFASSEFSIFVIDFNGLTAANSTFPEFVGKNFLALKDPNGIEFVKLYIDTAAKGDGWCEYHFLTADKVTTGDKIAYVKKLPVQINNIDAFVGCAFKQ